MKWIKDTFERLNTLTESLYGKLFNDLPIYEDDHYIGENKENPYKNLKAYQNMAEIAELKYLIELVGSGALGEIQRQQERIDLYEDVLFSIQSLICKRPFHDNNNVFEELLDTLEEVVEDNKHHFIYRNGYQLSERFKELADKYELDGEDYINI